jgi:DNA-directed RNA polymerase I and III subunit RPAC1
LIVQDEVLSHRLGLVPLAVDPSSLAWRSGEDAAGESNTVVFKLAVRCSRAADGSLVNDKGEAGV